MRRYVLIGCLGLIYLSPIAVFVFEAENNAEALLQLNDYVEQNAALGLDIVQLWSVDEGMRIYTVQL